MPIPNKVTNGFFVLSNNQLMIERENVYEYSNDLFNHSHFFVFNAFYDDANDVYDIYDANDAFDNDIYDIIANDVIDFYEYLFFQQSYNIIGYQHINNFCHDFILFINPKVPPAHQNRRTKTKFQTSKHDVLTISAFKHDHSDRKIV